MSAQRPFRSSSAPSLPVTLLVAAIATPLGAVRAQDAAATAATQAQHAAAAPTPGSLHSIGVSLDVLAAVGSSSARDAALSTLQAGGHDPNRRGFTLQEAELGLSGAVDSYCNAEAMIGAVIAPDTGETIVELEEAYLVTSSLPYDLQVKAGHYLTEFGRINPVHPHSWAWLDQPIVNTRFFGGDGMRMPGARIAWELPGSEPAQILFGVQNANGETATSFLASDEVYDERGIGGRFFTERENRSFNDYLYTARIDADRQLGDATTLGLGASVAFGPNATGNSADTVIYGVDFLLRCKGKDADAGSFALQGEVIARNFQAAEQVDENDTTVTGDEVTVPGETLQDWGCYLQGLWQCGSGWAVGLRGEYATGSGQSYQQDTDTFARDVDPFRADRVRISPLVACELSKMSRVRLQYNYDDTDALDDPEHSVWLGFVVMLGQHPKHVYRKPR